MNKSRKNKIKFNRSYSEIWGSRRTMNYTRQTVIFKVKRKHRKKERKNETRINYQLSAVKGKVTKRKTTNIHRRRDVKGMTNSFEGSMHQPEAVNSNWNTSRQWEQCNPFRTKIDTCDIRIWAHESSPPTHPPRIHGKVCVWKLDANKD